MDVSPVELIIKHLYMRHFLFYLKKQAHHNDNQIVITSLSLVSHTVSRNCCFLFLFFIPIHILIHSGSEGCNNMLLICSQDVHWNFCTNCFKSISKRIQQCCTNIFQFIKMAFRKWSRSTLMATNTRNNLFY